MAGLVLALLPVEASALSAARAKWLAEHKSLTRRLEASTTPDRAEAEALQIETLRQLSRIGDLGLPSPARAQCTRAAQSVAALAMDRLWGTPRTSRAERRARAASAARCERALRRH